MAIYYCHHASHFNGLWEGAVKSAKRHLLRTIGKTRLTFEELCNMLTTNPDILAVRIVMDQCIYTEFREYLSDLKSLKHIAIVRIR